MNFDLNIVEKLCARVFLQKNELLRLRKHWFLLIFI